VLFFIGNKQIAPGTKFAHVQTVNEQHQFLLKFLWQPSKLHSVHALLETTRGLESWQ